MKIQEYRQLSALAKKARDENLLFSRCWNIYEEAKFESIKMANLLKASNKAKRDARKK